MTPAEKIWKLLVHDGADYKVRQDAVLIVQEAYRLGREEAKEEAAKLADFLDDCPECGGGHRVGNTIRDKLK
jgi:hypothetical protein